MRAVWLEDGSLEVRTIPKPNPPPGEVLIRVLYAGVCNTDLELVAGYYPYTGVLGHEFVGRVEVGPPSWIEQRVVGEINAACGNCHFCDREVPSHCAQRTVLGIVGRDGAFASYLCLPTANLHRVPDTVSNEEATFTEPLAAALEIQQQLSIDPSQRVLVVGVGKLGQLIARSLRLTGCELLAVSRRPEPLDALRSHGVEGIAPSQIEERSFDIAIECTGNSEGFELARRALRPRGSLVMKSTYAGDLTFDAAKVVVDELQLIGSRCGPFAPALKLLANRSVRVNDLIEARYPITEALSALDHAARPGALKILLDFD